MCDNQGNSGRTPCHGQALDSGAGPPLFGGLFLARPVPLSFLILPAVSRLIVASVSGLRVSLFVAFRINRGSDRFHLARNFSQRILCSDGRTEAPHSTAPRHGPSFGNSRHVTAAWHTCDIVVTWVLFFCAARRRPAILTSSTAYAHPDAFTGSFLVGSIRAFGNAAG